MGSGRGVADDAAQTPSDYASAAGQRPPVCRQLSSPSRARFFEKELRPILHCAAGGGVVFSRQELSHAIKDQ